MIRLLVNVKKIIKTFLKLPNRPKNKIEKTSTTEPIGDCAID
jgi:hypothetical protein